MKEILPLNSFCEYRAACKVQIELEQKLSAFGYLSENDNDLFHDLKARTGKYHTDLWRKRNPKS
jgi:hypothetical protein